MNNDVGLKLTPLSRPQNCGSNSGTGVQAGVIQTLIDLRLNERVSIL